MTTGKDISPLAQEVLDAAREWREERRAAIVGEHREDSDPEDEDDGCPMCGRRKCRGYCGE